ncbi:MAG: DUF1080 domain-containing protein [Pirellulales bacterium]
MLRYLICAHLALLVLTRIATAEDKPESLFNGKDLSGWEGNPTIWSVEEEAIVGRVTADRPLKNNTFLIWTGGVLDDFRLRLEYRIEGGNSGVQYRSTVLDPKEFIVGGYQADIDSETVYTGILYDERGRGILAKRGERVKIDRNGKSEVTSFADAAELQKAVHTDGWNKYVIEARGPRLRHKINGKLMSETFDRDREKRVASGVLALQVHQGPPMTVRFRNIRLERLKDAE